MFVHQTVRLSMAAMTAILLAGCATMKPYQPPALATAATFAAGAHAPVDNSSTQWWLAFRDAKLDRLIALGLAQNLDIAGAVERINEADAAASVAGVAYLPTVSGSVAAQESRQNGANASGSVRGAATASWLIDLFGSYKNSRDAAQANLDAAYFGANAARLAFLSQVTTAYIDLRYYQESLALARQSVSSLQRTLDLTNALQNAGSGSRLDVLQAQSALDASSLQIPSLELGFVRSLNRLATLVSEEPGKLNADLQKGAPQPWPRLRVNAGVPADLIRQRPDIQAAERALAAAFAQAGIAEAQMYPSLTLNGNIQLVHAAAGGATNWSFGPTLNLPFLDGGQSRSNHRAALSRAEQAYISWQSAVRSAIEEAENALAAVQRDSRSIDAATRVRESATQQLELARFSYEAGEAQILDVLNAERAVVEARSGVASATQAYARNFVALNVAVGGGAAVLAAR